MIAASARTPALAQVRSLSTTTYRGYGVSTYVDPADNSFGFSVFADTTPGKARASVMARRRLSSRAEALSLAKQAVDLATAPAGVSGFGLQGFSFKSISKIFDKVGKGVTNNVGLLSTVGGAVLTATGVGAPAGIALAAAGNAAQGAVDAKAAGKDAKKAQAEADAQAAAAEAAAAAAAPAVVATPTAVAAPHKKPLWPWLAGGGAAVVLIGVGAWLYLRRK